MTIYWVRFSLRVLPREVDRFLEVQRSAVDGLSVITPLTPEAWRQAGPGCPSVCGRRRGDDRDGERFGEGRVASMFGPDSMPSRLMSV